MRRVRLSQTIKEPAPSMHESDFNILLRSAIFADVDKAVAQTARNVGFVQGEPKGAVIFVQGEAAKFLHVVLAGRVALVGRTNDGHEAVVEFFGPGEVVIAPAVLLDMPYLMSGVVTEESRIAYLPAAMIRELARSDIGFCHNLTLVLAKHWRLLANQIKDQKLKSAPQRLAAYLLGGAVMIDGKAVVDLTVDKRSLASRLGMTPENLSRNLSQLEAIGVSSNGKRIEIADPERLRAYCHDDGLA